MHLLIVYKLFDSLVIKQFTFLRLWAIMKWSFQINNFAISFSCQHAETTYNF